MRRSTVAALGALLALLAILGWWMGRSAVKVKRADDGNAPTPEAVTTPVRPASPSPAAAVVTVPRREAVSHLRVRAGWGSGPGQLGKKTDPESAPEGPMSLVVDRHGNLYVLDEINRRVQRWSADGRLLSSIPINGDTAQDLALGKNGAVALLDRLGERNVQLFSSDGKPLGEVGLVGKHLPEGGGATGLFTDSDGNLWVEREHQELVRVADSDGSSDADRPTAPGRPSRDGRVYLSGAIVDRAAGSVTVRGLDGSGALLWQSTVGLGAPILYLSLLDSDAAGNVYLAGHVGRSSLQPPYLIEDEQLIVVSLSPDGTPRGSLSLEAAPPEAESFRDLTVGDDGTLYRMVLGPSGVTIETYHF